ncbi:lysine methyltransferase domain-containing protein [Phthorimaea operculella]|nr:lysine methyltransferase domain-containing protein [Phthorimaea operculella]
MSSFKFNFSGDANPSDEIDNNEKAEEIKQVDWVESVEVDPGNIKEDLDAIAAHAKMFVCGDIEIGHVVAKDALLRIGDNNLKNAVELADKEHSDLVPGKYEGGLKIWECTYDLVEYLSGLENLSLKNMKVLDLGCGAGILGIYALIEGATATFQDYNKEVIECVTIPNVFLNAEEEDRSFDTSQIKFYSGDWGSFNNLLPDTEMFDVILTSETIYNPENYNKLIDLFLQRLTKTGMVFVAAKTCYFGVGGGTRQFEKCIEKNSLLKSEVCWKSEGGIQREIIKVTRKQDLYLIESSNK